MAKKGFPQSPPDEPEGWLTSYADLMSLLSCFFMLMMAFANYETPGVQTKAKIIAESFKGIGAVSELDMEKLKSEIARHPDFLERLKITLKDGELRIVFHGSAVFPEGSYQMSENTTSMVDSLIEIIKAHNSDYRIFIEGHADKDEYLVAGNMNHWSLSAARSATVVARFEYFGFKAEHMVAVAKGDREPVAEYRKALGSKDKGKEAQDIREIAKYNRRVVIRVLEPVVENKMRVTPGALFKDAEGDPGMDDASLFMDSKN